MEKREIFFMQTITEQSVYKSVYNDYSFTHIYYTGNPDRKNGIRIAFLGPHIFFFRDYPLYSQKNALIPEILPISRDFSVCAHKQPGTLRIFQDTHKRTGIIAGAVPKGFLNGDTS
jgi:hypothetical protein